MLDRKQLDSMKSIDVTEVERQTLVDINNIIINDSLNATEKMGSYIRQIKNPYCFLCGKTPVKIRFISENKTLVQSLGLYFSSLK